MIIYLAGDAYAEHVFEKLNWNFNRLDSFFYIRHGEWRKRAIPKYKKYLLDSGAFTFIMSKQKKKIDIDSYTDEYIDFIKNHNVELFFEMDVDAVWGYDKVKQLRERIERKVGKQSIPVFHKNRGLNDFKDMCKDYKYIALGIAGKDVPWGDWMTFKLFTDYANSNNVKMHGLGITGNKSIDNVNFYSVDSSSWTAGNRYKMLYQFNGKRLDKINIPKNNRIKDHKALALHNFTEWVKFANYKDQTCVQY
jgi:hypothetical protein